MTEIAKPVENRAVPEQSDEDSEHNVADTGTASNPGDSAISARTTPLVAATDLADRDNADILKRSNVRELPVDFPRVFFDQGPLKLGDTLPPSGATIAADGNGRLSSIKYANGDTRSFTYDDKGIIRTLDDNGKSFTNKDGELIGADGKPTGVKTPFVAPNGTYTFSNRDGNFVSVYPDRSQDIARPDMSVIKLNADGRITNVTYPDGVARNCEYDSQGRLRSVTDVNLHTNVVLKNFSDEQLAAANKSMDELKDDAQQQGVPLDQLAASQETALQSQERAGRPSGDRISGSEVIGEAAAGFAALNTRYGVRYDTVTRPDGTRVRQYYVKGENGQKVPVLETSSDNPREVERELKEWQSAKIRETEEKHGLRFSRDGEKVAGKDMRTPRIDELMGLDAGLNLAYPSTGRVAGRPVHVLFAVRPTSKADAYAFSTRDGQAYVLFEPMYRTFKGMRDLAIHEWAHLGEHNLRGRDPAAVAKWIKDMGFREVTLPTGQKQWQLRDKDGNYYAQRNGDERPYGTWTRVDDQGRPLRADGSLASGWNDRRAARRTTDQMREAVPVRPVTPYFYKPGEMGAEGLRFFRTGQQDRGALYMNDPKLYHITKDFDQKEIDTDPRYGRNPDGSSRFIRLPDGSIRPNNDANRRTVSEFEQDLQRQRLQRVLRRAS